jgi:hypothetical protein
MNATTLLAVPRHAVRAPNVWVGIFATVGLILGGCATPKEPVSAFGPYDPRVSAQTEGYETPPLMQAKDVLPDELLSGPYHTVDNTVVNDGYTNHYVVVTEDGEFPAAGLLELKARIAEAEAIAVLRAMNRGEVYGKGVVAGGKRTALLPVRQVRRYVQNPLHLVLAVPGEAMRVVGVFEDVAKLARMGLTQAYLKDLIGYDSAKKSLAKRLNVDEDSPNPVLQEELSEAAWAFYAGSAPMYLLEEFMPLVPIPHVTLVAGGESAGAAYEVYERELGDKSVRTQLRRIDVAKAERKQFKKHDAYTSRDRRTIASSLYSIDDAEGRDEYLDYALDAETPEQAQIIVHMAQAMAIYDATFDEILEVGRVGDTVMCYTKSGIVMMPMYADYVAWTQQFAGQVDNLMSWKPAAGEVAGREIWVTGEFTPWAHRELADRAVAVTENAIDELQRALEEQEKAPTGILARIGLGNAERALDRLAASAE